jgi:hypothetical protein
MTPEEIWERFCHDFDKAVEKCLDDGSPARLNIGTGEATVTIDIYRRKSQMKIFNEAMLDIAKKHRGMSVAPDPEISDG